MNKLSKQEYQILYSISRGRNNIERLLDIFDKKVIVTFLKKLEKEGLIKIEYRGGDIYGFIETQKGEVLLNSEEYKKWFDECGD